MRMVMSVLLFGEYASHSKTFQSHYGGFAGLVEV